MSKFDDLPQEILDHILGFVHDHATLKSCSLVSRSLLPSTRPYLFSTVSVSKSGLTRTLKLFVITAPHLARYVRRLELLAFTFRNFGAATRIDMTWLDQFTTSILHRFANVDSISLRWLVWETLPESTVRYLKKIAPQLREVHLEWITFRDFFASLGMLVLSSSRLKHLSLLENGGFEHYLDHTPIWPSRLEETHVFPRSLTQLNLTSGALNVEPEIVDCILAASPSFAVQHLCVPISFAATPDLLKATGDNLESLTLSLGSSFDVLDPVFRDVLEFISSAPKLTELGLRIYQRFEGTEADITRQIHSVLECTSQNTTLSLTVSDLRIEVTAERMAIISSSWTDMDILLHEKFPGVQRIIIKLRLRQPRADVSSSPSSSERFVRSLFHKAMPRAVETNRLVLKYEYMRKHKWVVAELPVVMAGEEGEKAEDGNVANVGKRLGSILGRIRHTQRWTSG